MLADGTLGRGTAPSGIQPKARGAGLRNGDRAPGRRINNGVQHMDTVSGLCKGWTPIDIYGVDQAMIRADGTWDKSKVRMRSWRFPSPAPGGGVVVGDSTCTVILAGVNGNRMPVPSDEYPLWRPIP